MSYADNTSVTPASSRDEIERTLGRFGADSFAYGHDATRALVGFRAHGRNIRLTVEIPAVDDRRFTHTPTGRQRTPKQAQAARQQEIRRLWRSLALMVKAKLEAVSSGIVDFETEWMPYVVLPGGQTVAEHLGPQLDAAYTTGQLPSGIAGLLGPGD